MQSNTQTFTGYPAPTSSTTYTPNQFFDVVLPNSSRGVVRIVGYMLRRILGWSDADGNPREPQVSFSYAELISQANVSRSMIKGALEEAISSNFIRCVRAPQPKLPGQNAVSGVYELAWDDSGEYVRNIEKFRGFYSENGNLTYIPNKFFDHTVREESLAVVKVVGAIIRHTIGFQTKFGMRRQQVEVSLRSLQRFTGITSREVLTDAITEAIKKNHIVRIVEGEFRAGGARESITSVYGVRWADGVASANPASKTTKPSDLSNFFAQNPSDRKTLGGEPQTQDVDPLSPSGRKPDPTNCPPKLAFAETIGLKNGPKEAISSVRNPVPREREHRYEKRTENGLKSGPTSVRKANQDRFEIRSDIEITGEITTLNNNKQKSAAVLELIERLKQLGFDSPTAKALVESFPIDRIERQLRYLPGRKPSKNPLGFLRRAIEEDWPPTLSVVSTARAKSIPPVTPENRGKSGKDYEEFCLSEAKNLRLALPEIYEAFCLEDAEFRERLLASPLVTGPLRDTLLISIDSNSAKESRFVEYLVKLGKISSLRQFESARAKRANG